MANGSLMQRDSSGLDVSQDAVQGLQRVGGLQQVSGQHVKSLAVMKPRAIARVQEKFLQEAALAGESFYYAWGKGKNRVEGPTVDCAMALARAFGNCAVDMLPVDDQPDAWIMTASFLDTETGFTLTRQFRQSKNWVVYGDLDPERKDDVRFQIGQSKATRNVIVNALPKWLVNKGVEAAKSGVRDFIEKLIKTDGLESVQRKAVDFICKFGISEERVLQKFGRATVKALEVEDLVLMKGDLNALKNGLDTAENLYPLEKPEEEKKPEGAAPGTLGELAQQAEAEQQTPRGTIVASPDVAVMTADRIKRIESATSEEELDTMLEEITAAVESKEMTDTDAHGYKSRIRERRKELKK